MAMEEIYPPAGVIWMKGVAPEVTLEELRSKTEAGFSVSPGLKLAA